MSKVTKVRPEDLSFFYNTLELIPVLNETPLTELRVSDIYILQRLSKAANHDGICIVLGVDFYYRNLIALRLLADLKSKPKLPFSESPKSAIYIGNNVSPELVVKILRDTSRRYTSLNPPPYQKYEDGDASVPNDEFVKENAVTKYEHEMFMRDYGMHHISIPIDYKQ